MKLELRIYSGGVLRRTATFENGAVRTIKIGHAESATIQIDDPGVAWLHAAIVVAGDTFSLTDLGFDHVTRLNERKILEPTQLTSGDIITIGGTTIEVMIGPDSVDENVDQSSPACVHAALGAADTVAHDVGLVRILSVVGDVDPSLLVDVDALFKYLGHRNSCDFVQPMWHQGPCDCGLHALTAKFPLWMRERVLELARTDTELRVYGPDPRGLFAKIEQGEEKP